MPTKKSSKPSKTNRAYTWFMRISLSFLLLLSTAAFVANLFIGKNEHATKISSGSSYQVRTDDGTIYTLQADCGGRRMGCNGGGLPIGSSVPIFVDDNGAVYGFRFSQLIGSLVGIFVFGIGVLIAWSPNPPKRSTQKTVSPTTPRR